VSGTGVPGDGLGWMVQNAQAAGPAKTGWGLSPPWLHNWPPQSPRPDSAVGAVREYVVFLERFAAL